MRQRPPKGFSCDTKTCVRYVMGFEPSLDKAISFGTCDVLGFDPRQGTICDRIGMAGASTPWRPFRLVAPFFGRLEVPPPPATCGPWAKTLSTFRFCPNVIARSRRCRPSEEVPPLGGGAAPQRRCRPSEEMPPLRGNAAPQRRCRPSEEVPPFRGGAAPQKRCRPSEEMPPLRGDVAP